MVYESLINGYTVDEYANEGVGKLINGAWSSFIKWCKDSIQKLIDKISDLITIFKIKTNREASPMDKKANIEITKFLRKISNLTKSADAIAKVTIDLSNPNDVNIDGTRNIDYWVDLETYINDAQECCDMINEIRNDGYVMHVHESGKNMILNSLNNLKRNLELAYKYIVRAEKVTNMPDAGDLFKKYLSKAIAVTTKLISLIQNTIPTDPD